MMFNCIFYNQLFDFMHRYKNVYTALHITIKMFYKMSCFVFHRLYSQMHVLNENFLGGELSPLGLWF